MQQEKSPRLGEGFLIRAGPDFDRESCFLVTAGMHSSITINGSAFQPLADPWPKAIGHYADQRLHCRVHLDFCAAFFPRVRLGAQLRLFGNVVSQQPWNIRKKLVEQFACFAGPDHGAPAAEVNTHDNGYSIPVHKVYARLLR